MSSRLLNLLPEDALRSYRRNRRGSIVGRGLVGAGILALVVAVFAAAAWQYTLILLNVEKERREIAERSEALRRAETFEEQLTSLTQEVRVLRELQNPQYDPSFLTRDIVSALPSGVVLQTMSTTLNGKGTLEKSSQGKKGSGEKEGVFVAGKAATRGDVLAFQHALEALPYMAHVEAPVENILKPTGATFSFALTLKPPTAQMTPMLQNPETANP